MTKDVFCRDKHVFVATRMILVAAPANDRDVDRKKKKEKKEKKSHIYIVLVTWYFRIVV